LGFQAGESPHRQPKNGANDDQGPCDEEVCWEVADAPYQPRSEERRQSGTAHARAEDTRRKTPPGRFEPRVHEWDANSKRGAGHPKEETEDQQQRVRLQRSRKGNQQHRNR
jgi:hypothetical protein